MSINSISNDNGHKPINISDSQQTNRQNQEAKPQNVHNIEQRQNVDSVNLTGTASQLRTLEQQLSSQPVVDVQKVDAIRRSITNGTFEIDAARVADKMIQLESEMNKKLI